MNTDAGIPGTPEQYPPQRSRESFAEDVAGPEDTDGVEVEAVTLHLRPETLEWATRVAWYRNFRSDALEKKISPRWSRKNVLENWIYTQADASQVQLAKLQSEHGPIPATKGEVKEYAFRVVASEKKQADAPKSDDSE